MGREITPLLDNGAPLQKDRAAKENTQCQTPETLTVSELKH